MRPIHIDFAPRSLRRTIEKIRPLIWLFGVIGFLLCLTAAINALRLIDWRDAAVTELLRIQAELAEKRAPPPKKLEIPDAQAAAVNTAIAQLNLPWSDIFFAIEAGTPGTIALLMIEPDTGKHFVKGMAEAKTSDGMIAYIEQLKRQELFKYVTLTKHEINGQDMNRPIRFQFEAQWGEMVP